MIAQIFVGVTSESQFALSDLTVTGYDPYDADKGEGGTSAAPRGVLANLPRLDKGVFENIFDWCRRPHCSPSAGDGADKHTALVAETIQKTYTLHARSITPDMQGTADGICGECLGHSAYDITVL